MDGDLVFTSSAGEALGLKDDSSVFFAGGTGICYKDSGISAGKLIVIPDIPGIREITEKDGYICIGACVTFTKALEHPDVPQYLKEALCFCGSFQKRNMATIGGNIASWRSDSYLIPTLIASGAMLLVMSADGSETISIEEYADGRGRYADALIACIYVKPEKSGLRVLSKRYANTVESHAYLTIAMGRDDMGFRIAIAIKGYGIFRPDIMNWGISWKKAGVVDDMFGSEEYKRYLTSVTLEDMYEKLGGEGGDDS